MLGRVVLTVASAGLLAAVPLSPAQARDSRPWFGWTTNTLELTQSTETALGIRPAAISTYTAFDEPFPQAWADEAVRRGVPLVISWEPWDSDLPLGTDQPAYALAGIARGEHDPYARRWATAAAASGATILLRFAPEMNGDWHAWSKSDSPADFRRAWRHLHRLFDEQGAAGVRWVFNPNAVFDGSTPITEYWPGAAFVDWLGVDGYNWAGVLPGRGYETVDAVFADTVRQLRSIGPGLPVMIAEGGAGPGAKDRWLPDLLSTAPRLGIRLVIWFEHDKETDWRLATATLPTSLPALLQQAGWRLAG